MEDDQMEGLEPFNKEGKEEKAFSAGNFNRPPRSPIEAPTIGRSTQSGHKPSRSERSRPEQSRHKHAARSTATDADIVTPTPTSNTAVDSLQTILAQDALDFWSDDALQLLERREDMKKIAEEVAGYTPEQFWNEYWRMELADEEVIMANKIINEEYKIWKKNAPYMYDVMYSKALDWPTLTTQWFRDVRNPPGEGAAIHRLLIGTHTSNDAPNYVEIVEFSLPKIVADPEDYDAEREEIGSGYNPSKKAIPPKFNIVQKIDHDGEVNKARYMPQKQDMIATMGINGQVSIFDRTKHSSQPTGKVNPQIELIGHTEEGFALDWHPMREGHLLTGSADKTVKFWNIQDFKASDKKLKATRTWKHHTAVVNDVRWSPHIPKAFATVSDDCTLKIIDTLDSSDSRAVFENENAHSDAINSVSWHPEVDFLLATGSADKSIAIWDLRMLTVKLHSCESHRDVVTQVEWHPSKKAMLASSSYDRRVCFWDLNRCGAEQTPEDAEDGPPELLFMHGGHTNNISDFSFNQNDPWLMCSAAEDNLIQIWRASDSILGQDRAAVSLKELGH